MVACETVSYFMSSLSYCKNLACAIILPCRKSSRWRWMQTVILSSINSGLTFDCSPCYPRPWKDKECGVKMWCPEWSPPLFPPKSDDALPRRRADYGRWVNWKDHLEPRTKKFVGNFLGSWKSPNYSWVNFLCTYTFTVGNFLGSWKSPNYTFTVAINLTSTKLMVLNCD